MRISLRNSLYLMLAGGIAVLLLVYDWIRFTVNLDSPFLTGLGDLLSIAMFALLYRTFKSFLIKKLHGLLETLRKLVAYSFFCAALISIVGIVLEKQGESSGVYLPRNVWQLLAVTAFSFGVAAFLVVLLKLTSDIIHIKPDKKVRRRFDLFMGFALAASVLSVFGNSTLVSTLRTIAFGIAILIAVFHIVSMNWIVYLTRKEKYKSLVHSLFLFILFGYSFASVGPADLAGGTLNFYSGPLAEFAKVTFLFLTIYFSLAFIVTLFHIPTSGVFEKKKRELDSYQNLSKVITNVMDTTEVLNNTVTVVGTVTQANKVWIELRTDDGSGNGARYSISATHKTSQYELSAFDFSKLRDEVAEKKHVIIHDTGEFTVFNLKEFPAKSLLAVPLTAHDEYIGVLYASHDMPFAFDEEEISTVSAFADTAAVAIQNSILFTKSIESERLQHELRIAHEMQLKLLPESLPSTERFETDFLSFPAFEVGGDYIDYSRIADGSYAFVVGDVSGKGTSAAFYMAYMKGVFQSLSASMKTPLEFMMEANDALESTLQRNFFITLTYLLLNEKSGELSVVRAGHTPGVLISGGKRRLIRPVGAGLGLEPSRDFGKHLEEERICLEHGDTLVLYTDGVTDQRDPQGDEFGEERFYHLVEKLSGGSATEIKGGIIRTLAEFSQGTDAVDDTTVLILKWR